MIWRQSNKAPDRWVAVDKSFLLSLIGPMAPKQNPRNPFTVLLLRRVFELLDVLANAIRQPQYHSPAPT